MTQKSQLLKYEEGIDTFLEFLIDIVGKNEFEVDTRRTLSSTGQNWTDSRIRNNGLAPATYIRSDGSEATLTLNKGLLRQLKNYAEKRASVIAGYFEKDTSRVEHELDDLAYRALNEIERYSSLDVILPCYNSEIGLDWSITSSLGRNMPHCGPLYNHYILNEVILSNARYVWENRDQLPDQSKEGIVSEAVDMISAIALNYSGSRENRKVRDLTKVYNPHPYDSVLSYRLVQDARSLLVEIVKEPGFAYLLDRPSKYDDEYKVPFREIINL